MKKRLVSLLLTLALLVLPVVSAGAAQPDPTPVQTQTETAEAAQHQYSYIALGDSIVAGIGLPDAVYQRNGRYYDVSGNYQGYSKDCYVARVAEGLGLSRDQTANYGMPALMSGDLLELVRTGSCQSASINFSLPDLRQELKHAQVITVEIGANDVLVPIMYGIASAMGGPQVFEALLPMLEGDFRQMDASSFAALRESLDSLNITAQQRKALLQLLSSGVADICAQSQASTLANLEALLQELKALNPDAQIVLVGYYNPVPLLPAPANPFAKHFRTLNRSVQKLAQQYGITEELLVPQQESTFTTGEDSDVSYIQQKGTLVVGITEFAPMDYKDENGQWIGFDADLAKLVAERLGVEIQFVVIDWGQKINELDSKAIDVVWNGMTLTDGVMSAMACTNAYCKNAQVVVVRGQ